MEKQKIAILGTGMVAQALAAKLSSLDYPVTIGTRDPAATLARTAPDAFGNPPFVVWRDKYPAVRLGTLADAAKDGQILINATSGAGSIDAIRSAGDENTAGKVLIDVSNPLDFSKGMPPSLFVCNTDSLGEQIQRAFPSIRVVKTLNTMSAPLMIEPRSLAGGAHSIFLSGNDPEAKKIVTSLLAEFGWTEIIDLGDISTARGTEMLLPIWLRLWNATKTPLFSLRVVR